MKGLVGAGLALWALSLAWTAGKSIDLPISITVPTTVPSPPEIKIALSVNEYLPNFAKYTKSLPYEEWPGGPPSETTPLAYKTAIAVMGTVYPNMKFNMNVSLPEGGYIFDPAYAHRRETSVTFAEFTTVLGMFPDRTTFYESNREGTFFKEVNITSLMKKRGFRK